MSEYENKKWYVHDGSKQSGPHTLEEVRSLVRLKKLRPENYAWCDGMANWSRVGDLAVLNSASEKLESAPPPLNVSPKVTPSKVTPSKVNSPEYIPPEKISPEKVSKASPITPNKSGTSSKPVTTNNPPITNSDEVSMLIAVSRDAFSKEDKTTAIDRSVLRAVEKEVNQVRKLSEKARIQAEGWTPKRILRFVLVVLLFLTFGWALLMLFSSPSKADEPVTTKTVDVEKLKERYWAKGDKEELSVVQNRIYTKKHRLELGIFGGSVATDPFLNVYNLGGFLAYHFSEYYAFEVIGWTYLVSNSSALNNLQTTQNVTANTNIPSYLIGGEFAFSPLYGKLSLLGKAIIYLDTKLTIGGGQIWTQTGNYLFPMIGIGEQIFLARNISFNIDYRFLIYNETLDHKTLGSTTLGPAVGTRLNLTNAVVAGLSFLF